MWEVTSSNTGNYDKCVKHKESGVEVIVHGELSDDRNIDISWTTLHQLVCDYLNANNVGIVPDEEHKHID